MSAKFKTAATRRIGPKAALLAGAAFVAATGAIAQVSGPTAPLRLRSDYFGYGASVSPRVGYTDNIELAPRGLEDDALILSNLFSGAAVMSTSRFTGIISGDLDFSYIISDSDDFAVNQRIGAASTFTAVENLFYIDLAGSTSRQLLGENARFSQNINAARGQRANVHTYSASPYFFRKFADTSAAELRYRWSQVFIDDTNSGANPFSGGLLNDSRSHEASASYDSGQSLGDLNAVMTIAGNITTEDGSVFVPRFRYEQATAMAALRYALTTSFALSGAIGYDAVNTEATPGLFNDEALSGLFWRAGFTARPGRKTMLRVEYGRRYDDDFIDADLTYEISDRFLFAAGANRTFETRAQSLAAEFRGLQRDTLEFAERLRDGAQLSAESIVQAANRYAANRITAQTVGIGVSNNVYARLTGVWDRTEITAAGSYQDTDYGFRQNEIYGVNLDLRRQLSRRLTAYGGAYWRHSETDFDPVTCQTSPFLFGFDVNAPLFDPVAACTAFALQNGRTDTVGGRVGAAYRIYSNASLFAEYSHSRRLADSPLLEYGENTVVAGITIDF